MEKKTFNDMMANLPTTETDMTKVMVEMEDGRKGWISAEGLAQVAAGLMPLGFQKIISIGSTGMAIKAVRINSSGQEFYINILGVNNKIKEANLTFSTTNNHTIPQLIKITNDSPIIHLSYKEYDDYIIIYFWHNAAYLTIRFVAIGKPIPEYTILNSESEIPEDAVLV